MFLHLPARRRSFGAGLVNAHEPLVLGGLEMHQSFQQRSTAVFFSLILLIPAVPSQTAFAQAAGTAVDEITVTARKREESLAEVPVAITAFSKEELESAGITSLLDPAVVGTAIWATPGSGIGALSMPLTPKSMA